TGSTGKTHQCVEDLAIFRAMPNMTVIAPCDGVEVRAAMWALMEHHGPAYLRLTRDAGPVITPRDRPFEIGRAYLLREGSDVTLSEHRPTPLKRLGLQDVFGESAPNAPLLEKYGLTPRHVATDARELLARTRA